jgi:hypothetical protein
LAPSLCGCASLSDLPAPLARALPASCLKLLTQTPLPAVTPTMDARVAFMKDEAALLSDKAHIAAYLACDGDLRAGYATKPKGGKP